MCACECGYASLDATTCNRRRRRRNTGSSGVCSWETGNKFSRCVVARGAFVWGGGRASSSTSSLSFNHFFSLFLSHSRKNHLRCVCAASMAKPATAARRPNTHTHTRTHSGGPPLVAPAWGRAHRQSEQGASLMGEAHVRRRRRRWQVRAIKECKNGGACVCKVAVFCFVFRVAR